LRFRGFALHQPESTLRDLPDTVESLPGISS
jgi:hypothetical protein